MHVPDAEGQKMEDYINWESSSIGQCYSNTIAPVHALGLHRDPSRSTSHAFIQELRYIPRGSGQRGTFETLRCGVFKMKDVEDAGLTKKLIAMATEFSSNAHKSIERNDSDVYRKFSMTMLTFGDDLPCMVRSGACSLGFLGPRAFKISSLMSSLLFVFP